MKLKFWKGWRVREKFKGFFVSGATKPKKKKEFWLHERSWYDRCKYYDDIYERHPLAKSQILTIAGQLMAEGVFTEAAGDYPRAKEAQQKCDELNEQIGLDVMLYETAVIMAKYGSCFWEKTFTPKFDVRIIPMQEAIEPKTQDAQGNITEWRQVINGQEVAVWRADEIVHFAWNVTSKSWPYGTSLLVGLENEFEILAQLEEDLKEYMHKQAFPKDLWQVGDKDWAPTEDEIDNIRSKIKNWEPGDEFVTSYTINHIPGGTGGSPLTDIEKILNFIKENAIDGLMVPPISKQWSSTMASAREMMPWARANLIKPMQRLIRRKIEKEVYQPYLMDLGYSVKVTPKLKFEPPDAHKTEEAEYWATLVGAGIVPPEIAAEELGYGKKLEELKQQQIEKELPEVPEAPEPPPLPLPLPFSKLPEKGEE